MFYIKTVQPSGRSVKTDITDENVFTHCPECGREIPIDLAEVFSDGEGDLFSTSVLCAACTKKRTEKHLFSDGITITADGIALLADVMCKAGYGEQLYALFDRFEIGGISDLEPEEWRPFADALAGLAVAGDLL